jgi:hypothetical protein
MSFVGRFWVRVPTATEGVVVREELFDMLLSAHSWVVRAISAHPLTTGDGEVIFMNDARKEQVVYRFSDEQR